MKGILRFWFAYAEFRLEVVPEWTTCMRNSSESVLMSLGREITSCFTTTSMYKIGRVTAQDWGTGLKSGFWRGGAFLGLFRPDQHPFREAHEFQSTR